ncbi:MAG: GtrA family protein [Clostridia bacterium]|nr:GtrA family protein [Clostridia bacterium]
MEQEKSRTAEVIRFALTGGVCLLVELAVLILLKGQLGIDTLIATPIAFLVSVILNYILCVVWVFRGTKNRGAGAKAGFLVTSLIGLGLNELLMLLFRVTLGEDAVILTLGGREISMYVLNKCLATLIVMIWNYFSKRAVLYRKAKP